MARAYYNEFDPYAAQWLRNLIAAGHIAPGEVDERSIVDVQPDDLHGFTQCHFFAGIGGWSLAARLAGWPDDRELWTGSCPCQPFSVAGKQAGQADERHLWPDQFRLISARRPDVWMGEQVAAAVGKHWLDGVHSDLESIGYASGAAVVPACAVDAPHRRERAWIVADARRGRRSGSGEGQGQQPGRAEAVGAGEGYVANTDGFSGRQEHQDAGRGLDGSAAGEVARPACASDVALGDPIGTGLEGQRRNGDDWDQPRRIDTNPTGSVAAPSGGNVGNAAGGVREERTGLGEASSERAAGGPDSGSLANPDQSGESEGREQRSGQQRGAGSNSRGSAWVGAEWLSGADGKARRFEPGIRLLAHGIPARVGKLRAYGNAIVPQVAAEVIGAYLDCEVAS